MNRTCNCCALRRASLLSVLFAVSHGLRAKRTAIYAIVQPFYAQDVEDLGKQSCALHSKCSKTYPIDLVLYYQGSRGDVVTSYNKTAPGVVRGLTRKPHLGTCFNDVRVEEGNVSLDAKYPLAPGIQFFNMLRMKPPMWGYAAIYQMELDVLPLHGGWLAGLLALFDKSAAGDAWVVGGVYKTDCMQGLNSSHTSNAVLGFPVDNNTRRQHINGNAIYVPRREFVEWSLQRQNITERAYDFYLFREMLSDSSISKDTFREDPLFVDCKPTGAHGGSTLPMAEIIKKFPRAMLAHTSFGGDDNQPPVEVQEPGS